MQSSMVLRVAAIISTIAEIVLLDSLAAQVLPTLRSSHSGRTHMVHQAPLAAVFRQQ